MPLQQLQRPAGWEQSHDSLCISRTAEPARSCQSRSMKTTAGSPSAYAVVQQVTTGPEHQQQHSRHLAAIISGQQQLCRTQKGCISTQPSRICNLAGSASQTLLQQATWCRTLSPVATGNSSSHVAGQAREFATKLKPKFTGGKVKPYSSLKERFKMTATGKFIRFRPGHRHKRVVKSGRQNRELSSSRVVYPASANIMKRLGFARRHFA